jgi:hypothetical protein
MTEGTMVRVRQTGEVGQVVEVTHWGGREELMVDLGDAEVGFDRAELEPVR